MSELFELQWYVHHFGHCERIGHAASVGSAACICIRAAG